ncbi:MAG: GGDEF domain-containing protein, partial [Deltaproteobacteria bacterium]
MVKTLIIEQEKYNRLLEENTELKNLLGLYQASQAITSSLEVSRVYRLLVDAVAQETGVSRAIGIFIEDSSLTVKEVRGLTESAALFFRDVILATVQKQLQHRHFGKRIRFKKVQETSDGSGAGIKEGYLLFIRNKDILLGIIALFNEPGECLPDMRLHKKNISFLLEQSSFGFANAETHTLTKEMLFIDDLTGLFNYRYLEVALDRELKRAERYSSNLAILFLDMDTFKQVNDCHGHLVGSKVLIEMGGLLRRSVRDVDVVIRYGGDEYTVILVETDATIAAKVAERIRELVDLLVFQASEGLNIHLTCC